MKTSSKRKPAPKKPTKPRAIRTSQHLHVVHPKHTGHVLPRSKTSYPVLAMILLCVGVFLVGWTRFVTADPYPDPITNSYTVHASVPGPPPTVAATIDVPAAGDVFTGTPITVSGSCPLNSYVSIERNGFNGGVALCDPTGKYQILTDLFPGINQLVAQDYSLTDAVGPPSTTVTVNYKVPGAGGSTGGGSSSGGNTSSGQQSGTTSTAIINSKVPYNPSNTSLPQPLFLQTNFTFLGYYVGDTANWKVSVAGGDAPYAVDVEWGDGSHTLYSRSQATTLTLQHVYKKAGGYHSSYNVKITATDAAGDQTYMQLIAIITNRPKTVIGGAQNTSGTLGSSGMFSTENIAKMAKYIWPSYAVVVLMLISFWLGERREFGYLKPRLKKLRHG